jgi:hypothetical protein
MYSTDSSLKLRLSGSLNWMWRGAFPAAFAEPDGVHIVPRIFYPSSQHGNVYDDFGAALLDPYESISRLPVISRSITWSASEAPEDSISAFTIVNSPIINVSFANSQALCMDLLVEDST